MMYSQKLKLVYLDPPKTGSQTLDKVFQGMGCSYHKYKNDKGRVLDKHQRIIPPKYKNYTVFASVRNPYTRALSLYNYDRKRKYNFIKLNMRSFEEYMTGIIEKTSGLPADTDNLHQYRYFPCWKYLSLQPVDHIIHMESIKPDLLDSGLNVKTKSVPHLNSGKNTKTFDDIKTPELIDLINTWAGTDFEQYGYQRL